MWCVMLGFVVVVFGPLDQKWMVMIKSGLGVWIVRSYMVCCVGICSNFIIAFRLKMDGGDH